MLRYISNFFPLENVQIIGAICVLYAWHVLEQCDEFEAHVFLSEKLSGAGILYSTGQDL